MENKLRVWWNSNFGQPPFTMPIENIAKGKEIIGILTNYDLYLGDLIDSNACGIEEFVDGDWSEWYHEESGEDICGVIREGIELPVEDLTFKATRLYPPRELRVMRASTVLKMKEVLESEAEKADMDNHKQVDAISLQLGSIDIEMKLLELLNRYEDHLEKIKSRK